jgi:competence protein ComEC
MIERGWKYYPALKLAIPFAAGIVFSRVAGLPVQSIMPPLALMLLLLAIAVDREHPALTLLLLCTLFIAGAFCHALRSGSTFDGLDRSTIRDAELVGRTISQPSLRNGRVEYLVECDSLLYRNSVARLGTRVLVRVYDRSVEPSQVPSYGDRLSIVGTAEVPGEPANPGEFDYRAYLRSQGIGMTLSVNRASTTYIFRRGDLSWFEEGTEWVRARARDFADDYVGGEEGDIVRALLLGEREYIDEPTREAFMRTGTTHVLAVSGLHVAVIALALFVVVSWIPNRMTQLLLYSSLLSIYAVVAGGGPSIVRAVIMAVVFKLAQTFSRIPRTLNTLAFSALVIMVIWPEQLFDVGFQLSFASVAGIILLYIPLYRKLHDRYRIIQRSIVVSWLAKALLLSFSAQLLTFPLVLHYFGWVSLVAPLVNIVVVPLTSLALAAGVAGTLFCWLPSAAASFGGTAYLLLASTERLVGWGGSLSMAGIEMRTIGAAGAMVMGAMAVYLLLSRTVQQMAVRLLSYILAAGCVILLDRIIDPLGRIDEGDLLLLHARQGVAVGSLRGDTLCLYVAGSADSSLVRFIGEPLRRRLGAVALRSVDLDSADSEGRGELIPISDQPEEYAMRSLPVILSNTAQRPLAIVRSGDARFLQVPMRSELDEARLLGFDGGRWEVKRWR